MKRTVTEKEIGRRLDEVLTSWEAAPTRSKVQQLIKDGKVNVNGLSKKASYKLDNNDVVEYEEFEEKPLQLEKENIPLDIVYEDKDIVVINKPAGLVVHPGNGHPSGTLVNALLYHIDELANDDDCVRPGLVHRIDKDTSGLLVVAKNDTAFRFLQDQLKDHTMHREYRAIVKGIIAEEEAMIDAPIGRDITHPTKFGVNGRDSKEAVTYFQVIERFPRSNATYVDCRLKTGRTHQIRVHMDYIGHPLIGDPLYGSGNKHIFRDGQLLHAYKLTFIHPSTKEEASFRAPLPDYYEKVLEKLEIKEEE